jgi:uncharacterized protein YuzE
MEFNSNVVDATFEVNENIYIDLDNEGKLVSITIEHAKDNAKLPEFSYQEYAKYSA